MKVNGWCALIENKVIGLLFFEEPTVTGKTFLVISSYDGEQCVVFVGSSPVTSGTTSFSYHVHAFLNSLSGSFLIIG
jgi:hypothetical protein